MKFTAPLAVSALLMLGLAACTPPAPPTPGPGPGPVGITLTCAAGTVMVGQTLTCTAETVGGQGSALQGQAAFTRTGPACRRRAW